MIKWLRLATALGLVAMANCDLKAQNLLRNGSFEGGNSFWITDGKVTEGDAKFGTQAMVLGVTSDPGEPMRSAPFPLKPGGQVTASFWAKSDVAGSIHAGIWPTKRDLCQSSGFWFKYPLEQPSNPAWTHYSFTFTIPSGDFGDTGWMLVINTPRPGKIDGVSVSDAAATDSFEPRVPVELVSEATNLPGYASNGNLLAPDFEVQLAAHVTNYDSSAKVAKLKFELLNYEGKRAILPAVEKDVTLAPNATVTETVPLKLPAEGFMLGRVTALASDGSTLDQCDTPLTVLRYPKSATTPNPDERFGASYRGSHILSLGQTVGFAWSRWTWKGMGWSEVQPVDGPLKFPDDLVKEMKDKGHSLNYVLYNLPDWNKGDNFLPKDMQWSAADPKWNDLSLNTSWDKYVTGMVSHYKDESIVWEFANEPDLGSPAFPWDIYFVMAQRTAQLVKQANPKATFVVDCAYPNPTELQLDFMKRGGFKFSDVYSWHNYSEAGVGGLYTVLTLKGLAKTGGNADCKIWFNEGGAFINSSHSNPAYAVGHTAPVDWANALVREQAEMFAAGQDKFIMFHIGYDDHGRSPWDWLVNGGTELWDEKDDPTIGVATWNVLIDQLGLSTFVKTYKNSQYMVHIFQDNRNHRGIAVVYARKGDQTLQFKATNLIQRDIMGHDEPLADAGGLTSVNLPADGRPFYIYSKDNIDGNALADQLEPQ